MSFERDGRMLQPRYLAGGGEEEEEEEGEVMDDGTLPTRLLRIRKDRYCLCSPVSTGVGKGQGGMRASLERLAT
jgi:hypothetical protein